MSDLIRKLVEVEQAAASITESAGEKKKEMTREHARRLEALVRQVHAQSEEQLKNQKKQLEAKIEEELRSQQEELQLQIRGMEENYEKNHTQIAEKLLEHIAQP